MKKKNHFFRLSALMMALMINSAIQLFACTGISLHAKDGSFIVARTMEWGTFYMESRYVIIPRGYSQTAITPTGINGMTITTKYGYVGIGVLEDNLIAEGMNEKGLMGELFYFPNYGEYKPYSEKNQMSTITDGQFLTWALGKFATISEMEKEIHKIHLTAYGKGFGSAHFRLADATGRQVVLESLNGELKIFEDKIGVITNAPSFDWMMTNLNTYVNVFGGTADKHEVCPGVTLQSFGVGSSSIGLPGDLTPPSRFVRAAFYIHTAPQQNNGHNAVMQSFQILNNFDIPVGTEYRNKQDIPDLISATQWTTSCDVKNLRFYYRTAWNYTIRCIDIKAIDFSKVEYQTGPLDRVKQHPVEFIGIK